VCKKCGRDDHVSGRHRQNVKKEYFRKKDGSPLREATRTFPHLPHRRKFRKVLSRCGITWTNPTRRLRGNRSGSRGFVICAFSLHKVVTPQHTVSSIFTFSHLLDFYYHLQGKRQRKERVIRDEEYFGLRQKHGLSEIAYDGSYRSYLIQSIAVQHETAMRNCAYSRVVRYFYEAWKRKTTPNWIWKLRVYEELFSPDYITARIVWRSLIFYENSTYLKAFGDSEIRKSAGGRYSLVPFTHRLSVWYSERGSRSFKVFPVFHPGTKHLRYNAKALFELLRVSLKIKNVTKPEFMESTPFYWWWYFNLNHTARWIRRATQSHRKRDARRLLCCSLQSVSIALSQWTDIATAPRQNRKYRTSRKQ